MNIKKHGFLSFPFGNKKGADLPINTIIIAAIVLVVLVVLWAIFTGRMGKFTSELKTQTEGKEDCTQGDKGAWRVGACDPGETIYIAKDADKNPGKICCRKV